MKVKLLLIVLAFSFHQSMVNAQDITKNSFGKGIAIFAKDSSFSMKFGTRMQTIYQSEYLENADPKYSDKIYLKRARLKFDGDIYSNLMYKIEYDLVGASFLDAVVKWNVLGNFELWFGQTKLPGNRERVISSQKLQFVDRSQLNAKYNIDRDKGIQLWHHFKIGNIQVKEGLAVSQGEGRNVTTDNHGYDYTGRLEILPFGEFKGEGDYFAADLKREEKPKLALGVTYDYNQKASKSGGQLGSALSEERDLSTIFADLMFKYKGLSVMAEYANKITSTGSSAITDSSGTVLEAFYTGTGINGQIGYLFKNNWELAARYTDIVPEKVTENDHITEYTLGISKYIVGHSLKVQSDVTLHQEAGSDDELHYRLQLEVSF